MNLFSAESVRALQNQPKHERQINDAARAGKTTVVLGYEHKLVAQAAHARLYGLGFKVGKLKKKGGQDGDEFQFDVSW